MTYAPFPKRERERKQDGNAEGKAHTHKKK